MSLAKLLKPINDRQKEREQKFNDLLITLNQQRLQGKHFVAIQTNYMLDSSISFSQYIFQNKRLITLIGERHDLKWKCQEDSLTVAQYCKMAVERNQKCRVMLEFHPSVDPSTSQSESIKTTVASLQSINRTNQIIAFDKRDDFLTHNNHIKLYHDISPPYFISLGHENVFNYYVKIFYDKFILFGLNDATAHTTDEATRYLYDIFLKDTISHFDNIRDKLNKGEDLQNIRQELWHAWKKVCDFFILKEVLGSDDIDEYIVIVGKNHTHNLDKILPTIPYLTTLNFQDSKNQSDCVTLFQSYLV